MSETIEIDVRLYASLGRYAPLGGTGGPFRLQIPCGTDLAGLLARLGVPPAELKTSYVNHRRQEGGYRLKDGDRVALFPPIAGG
jgi:hypothetical protein